MLTRTGLSALTGHCTPKKPSIIVGQIHHHHLQQQYRPFVQSFLSSALGPCPLRQLTHTKTLPYSAQTIFKAVSDVAGYPSFLPFTISSHVTSRDALGYPTRARLTIGYDKLGLQENWDSIVACDPERGVVEARSSDQDTASQGLFQVLNTRWRINSLPSTAENDDAQEKNPRTSVTLNVDVKFRNPVYDQVFAQAEQKVAGIMISAFEKRAKELEGR
ncbi:hypothetical protein DV738_g3502, partial [Chaetothyriales sp. CBS 135597]